MDEGFLEVSTAALGCPPVSPGAFSAAAALAEELRRYVLSVTGYVLSAGISFNKLFSKLASRRAKPDGVFIITPADSVELLPGLSVEEIPGCGGDVATALAARGVRTCKDAQALSLADLQSVLPAGRRAELLFKLCRGDDDAPVVATGPPKSVQSQASFTPLVLWDRTQPASSVSAGGSLPPALDLMEPTAPWQLGRLRRMLLTLAVDLVQRVEEDAGEFGRHPTSLGCSVQLYTCTAEDIHRELGKARLLSTGPRPPAAAAGQMGGAGASDAAGASAAAATHGFVQTTMLLDSSIVHWPVPERVLPLCPSASVEDLTAAGLNAGPGYSSTATAASSSGGGSSGGGYSSSSGLPEIHWVKSAAELRRGPGQIATRSCAFPVEAATLPHTSAATASAATAAGVASATAAAPAAGASEDISLSERDPRVVACLEAATKLYVAAVKAAATADGWSWNEATSSVLPLPVSFETVDGASRAEASDLGPADKVALAKQRINSFTLPLAIVKIALIAAGFEGGPAPIGIRSFFGSGVAAASGTTEGGSRSSRTLPYKRTAGLGDVGAATASSEAAVSPSAPAAGGKRPRIAQPESTDSSGAEEVLCIENCAADTTASPADAELQSLRVAAAEANSALLCGAPVKLSGLLSIDMLSMRSLNSK